MSLRNVEPGDNDFFQWGWGWCATLLKQTTCLVVGCGLRNSLSLVSLPQLELSLISVENFLDALGLGGAALLLWFPKFKPIFLEHTCDCMCSQTLLNLRILPKYWGINEFLPLRCSWAICACGILDSLGTNSLLLLSAISNDALPILLPCEANQEA